MILFKYGEQTHYTIVMGDFKAKVGGQTNTSERATGCFGPGQRNERGDTGITELELGPSENSYSRARKRSVIVVLEVGGFHTGCLVTKRCTAHGRRVICPARQSSGE